MKSRVKIKKSNRFLFGIGFKIFTLILVIIVSALVAKNRLKNDKKVINKFHQNIETENSVKSSENQKIN